MTYAIITPSYSGDFERCRLLAESIERFVVNAEHYVLVDDIDVSQFKPIERFGSHVISTNELMDPALFRIPWTRIWSNRRGDLLRGWITQQIRKLAFASISSCENILCVDSDVVFIRPFSPDSKSRGDKTPLFEIDWRDDQNVRWANDSRRLLGLAERNSTFGYVHPTFWRKTLVNGLLSRLEEVSQRPWQLTIGRYSSFSEYVLYGTYVREAVGLDAADLYSFDEPLMHLSWDYNLRDRAQLIKFLENMPAKSVAAMFHSKDRLPVASYEDAVRDIWSRTSI